MNEKFFNLRKGYKKATRFKVINQRQLNARVNKHTSMLIFSTVKESDLSYLMS
jgi:hypothetical protein